ncbi:MAG TPA: rod shape-determining protein MreD [Pedococcus sp.]|jgi:rod shape-determining protein MreD|nr:rod shape-determining protein MreD [Pedococcus sp.]
MSARLPATALRGVLLVLAALLSVSTWGRGVAVVPDLVLPIVVAGALLTGPSGGALLGLGAGWVVDLMPPGAHVLGTNALLYAAAGLLAGAARREGPAPWGWVAAVGVAGTAVLTAGRIVVGLLSGVTLAWSATGLRALLTALLCGLVVPGLVRLEQWLVRRRAW